MGQIAPTLGLARKTSAEAKNGSEWRIATGDGFFFLESIAPAPTKNFFRLLTTALLTLHSIMRRLKVASSTNWLKPVA
jgi:hypothetical protein